MLRVVQREDVSNAEALKALSAFTKGDTTTLPTDQFFQLQRVQEELKRVVSSEKEEAKQRAQ
jgi:hypothetical protein